MDLAAQETTVRGKVMWVVSIPKSHGGKRKRVYRETKLDALNAAKAVLNERSQHGEELSSLTISERAFILRWRDKLTLQQLDEAAQETLERLGGAVTMAKAVAAYQKAPREHALSRAHAADLRCRLKEYEAHFGERLLSNITPGELQDFIRMAGASAPNFHKIGRALFRHAERHRWISRNPFATLPRPTVTPGDKDVFTPEQMGDMLRSASGIGASVVKAAAGPGTGGKWAQEAHPALLRLLILGGFCGLRYCECRRLQVSDVDLSAGEHGELHVRKMKTQRRGIRERWVRLTPLARAWLDHAKLPDAGPVVALSDANLRIVRSRLVEREIIPAWLDNGLRRSFGSYHLAAFEDAARTAEIMGHTDAETTKSKYRVPRRQEIALKWFALTPEAVLA